MTQRYPHRNPLITTQRRDYTWVYLLIAIGAILTWAFTVDVERWFMS